MTLTEFATKIAAVVEPDTLAVPVLPRPTPTEELFCMAAKAIEQYGWRQRALGTEQSGFCVMGALLKAYADSRGLAYMRMIHSIGIPYQVSSAARYLSNVVGGPITTWNDQPGRTKEQVLALLKEHSGCE